jgi:hypothetical protein
VAGLRCSPHDRTTTKPSRFQEIFAVEDMPELSAEDISAIEDAGSLVHIRIFMRDAYGE